MLRILHTADWHLGKKLDNFSRIEEQKEQLNEICEIADSEEADVILIAGDLYDVYNPPNEAVTLFYQTLKRLAKDGQRAVIAIAGNHDSPDRIEAPDPLAIECGIFLIGYPYSQILPVRLASGLEILRSEPGFLELKVPYKDTPLRIITCPYANELRMKTFLGDNDREEELRNLLQQKWQQLAEKYCDDKGVNFLTAHLLMMQKSGPMPEENTDEEKSIIYIGGAQVIYSEQIPSQIQYVALGHIHRRMDIDTQPCPVVYSSSILPYSFSDNAQDKYVVMVEAEAGKKVNYRSVALKKGKKLLRNRFEDVEAAIVWLKENPNTLVELTIVSEQYLTAQIRRKLYEVHEGIKAIIPETKNPLMPGKSGKLLDLNKNKVELFIDYFKYKNNQQEPNERLLNLFKELLNKEEEEL